MGHKFIIKNYTDLMDLQVMFYIAEVMKQGFKSKTKQGHQYCFLTRFEKELNNIIVDCVKRNDTYTFRVYLERA